MNSIVAVDANWAIGNKGDLLTFIPADLKNFKNVTMGKVVVLGRKTLAGFPGGKPLKGRTNIILSRDDSYQVEGAIIVHSLEELMEELKKYETDEVFCIGGGTVYDMLMPYCTLAYVTKIKKVYEADTYFKNLDEDENWEVMNEGEEQDHDGLKFAFVTYQNKYPKDFVKI